MQLVTLSPLAADAVELGIAIPSTAVPMQGWSLQASSQGFWDSAEGQQAAASDARKRPGNGGSLRTKHTLKSQTSGRTGSGALVAAAGEDIIQAALRSCTPFWLFADIGLWCCRAVRYHRALHQSWLPAGKLMLPSQIAAPSSQLSATTVGRFRAPIAAV